MIENNKARTPKFIEPEKLNDVLAAARASQRREHAYGHNTKDEMDPALRRMIAVTTSDVKRWLDKKKVERNKEGRLVLNAMQYKAVQKVAD